MSSEDNLEVTVDHQKTKHLVKSQYYDVMVKVDTDVYYLDKLQLAWKSDYFEKFLIEYSNQDECSLIELRAMDSDTFSTITDIIYGKTLTSVLNHDNCIALLMAMDYLQMEIDVETYATFMKSNSVLDVEIIGLYTFMKENPNLQCLLPSVLEYLSNHLANMRNNADLMCLPVDDITRIISSQSYVGYSSMTEDMREICLICAEWIYHDLQNRLRHSVRLVNAVKQRFCYLNAMKDEDFNNLTVSSDIAKQMNPEMIAKHFYKFVVCDGEINPVPQKLPKYEEKKAPISCEKNHRKKLTKLLENGYFHNIVLNVGEKTYKLHRFKLCPASAHFAEISSTKQSSHADAQCAEALTQRSITSEQYSILGVDQTTCDMIFEYIYFDELRLTSETITPVFKAASTFRMENLMTECVRLMKKNIEEMCSSIDSFPIRFISFDMLEDLLISSSHFCDNPHRIKKVCTKWVFHDVKNRYHLIPRIALAINRNRTTSYKMEVPTDLNDCTERMIRYELWKTLKSTSLIPVAKKTTPKIYSFNKKLCEIPVFVAWTWQTSTIHVLNARLGQIASLCLCLSNSNPWKNHSRICLVNISAALVDDNLFIMLSLDADYFVFYVFNSSSKKFISLNSCVNAKLSWWRKFSLLSCRGQIYCCFNLGHVLKYSIELNHWIMFSKKPGFSDEDLMDEDVWFTSDGDKLYRLYASNGSSYIVNEFNFKLNLWLPLTYMSFTRTSSEIQDLTIINGDVLTVVFDSYFKSFDPRSRTWRRFPLTGDDVNFRILKSFASIQYENIYLHVFANKLHQWSETNQCWELKEELQLETTSPEPMENLGLYECIGAVHGHDVRTPRQLLYR
ncbi:uncharacterized protein LOC135835364 [Planococcus citri]|uniref:uncharacterized protein LOC135835364 n=1 Tax=Planococcus citri TaxID=170843 RepID=UPI0031F8EB62